ncbi:hypothetical protein CHS0354_025483 [Potamilus streckersoni]|uniref:FZ domain-containing protein n=1 Tax=Potamilus streckersoni TaxID=2493646 RepID=A0AAE0RRX8_9BIVA|nr:hypothetical protein CHS0354_025483 [Potamilus streckersoni]
MAAFLGVAAIMALYSKYSYGDATVMTSASDSSSTVGDGPQEVIVPMCQNLITYNMTKLPNSFGHNTQVEVYRVLEPLWSFIDYGCSNNFRQLVCGTYLPEYRHDPPRVLPPCKKTCVKAKKLCGRILKQLGTKWPKQLKCRGLPTQRDTCIDVIPEPSPNQTKHTYCDKIPLPMCQNIAFRTGSLPNMFFQRSLEEIMTEMQFYEPLVLSGCSPNLVFLLCGTYMPFCIKNENPFTLPCQELCKSVKADCELDFQLLYRGLPWPNKLQCQRYPKKTNDSPWSCVMPTDLN